LGDQVGEAVSGTLYYVPYQEFDRLRALLPGSIIEKTGIFAAFCRINTLYMIARAGSGHIGSSFSSLDIMSWLLINEIRIPSERDTTSPRDIFFSSKGHDAPGLYNVFIGLGRLDFNLIHTLRKLGGLPGHPDIATPNIVTNTGSLGMGISKAKGMIFANRLLQRTGNVFVLTGDGELQEGQFWESLVSAANRQLHELVVVIDHNKLQSDTLVSKVSDLGDLEAKLSAFGWHVSRCDGNDLTAFSSTLAAAKSVIDKPKVIIADTIKGKGVSFMEHTSIDSDVENYKFHSGAPTAESYVHAAQELIDNANAMLTALGAALLELESVIRPVVVLPDNPQRLIQAYSAALIDQARKNPNIVALDADLILDTGLIPFQQEFPDRFVECGIAEQDMVSQAGGMALRGLLPIVHSFACFLASRPNEQIYNNATEHTKIIYVGSLAGVLPGGPGHSHQAVRDISALGAIPGLVMMEPSCEAEVFALLEWCVKYSKSSSYIRLNSLPWVINYVYSKMEVAILGRGQVILAGNQIAIISHGPAMLALAISAAEIIKEMNGITIKIINLPWLNYVDGDWLDSVLTNCDAVVCIEDHYEIGGQADFIQQALSRDSSNCRIMRKVGLRGVPSSGTNAEVLEREGLDGKSIVQTILAILSNLQTSIKG
jgi:transketolase